MSDSVQPRRRQPPGSSVPGILQARTLEWVAISFSNAWKWKVKVKSLSRISLLATPWTAAYQAPPSIGFSRQEYWSGVPLPSLKEWSKSYQITNGIFHRTRTKISQFIWKYKRPRIIKAVLRKTGAGAMELEESISWLQIILQSYSHQESVVLAQKQKYRPMEQDRKPRKKPMHLWVPYFWQRRQEYTKGQRQPLQ